MDQLEPAGDLLVQAIADFGESISVDPSDLRIVEHLALAERLLALLLLDESIEQALVLSTQAQSRVLRVIDTATMKARTALNAGIVANTHGQILLESGDEAGARSTWSRALELLASQSSMALIQVAVQRQLVIHLQGESAAADQATQLSIAGFDDPRFR